MADNAADAGTSETIALAAKFRGALASSCELIGLQLNDLGLSFRPMVSAIAEIGRQIHGQMTDDVTTALAQRVALLAAKAAGWPELRAEWIKILRTSRSSEEAEAIADTAWRTHAPRRAAVAARASRSLTSSRRLQQLERQVEESTEEAQARKLASATNAVERAIDRELRFQARARRQAQCHRSCMA